MSTTQQKPQFKAPTRLTLPDQRTYTPVPSRHHGKVTFAIVSVLAGSVGVAALWMGLGGSDEVQAPPVVPSSVQANTDTSATAFEHRLQAPAGQGSANAAEQGSRSGLSPQEWSSSLEAQNRRAQAEQLAQQQAQPQPQRTESPRIQRLGVAGQSSASAVEPQLPAGEGYRSPQERADAHHLPR